MRRRYSAFFFIVLLGTLLVPTTATAQYANTDDLSDLRGALRSVGQQYADGYVQPITDTFGASMGAGLFRSADVGNSLIPGFPVDIYLGLSVPGTLTASMKTRFEPINEQIGTTSVRFPNGETREGEIFMEFSEGEEISDVPTVLGETSPPPPPNQGGPSLDLVTRIDGEEVDRKSIRPPQGLLNTPIVGLPVPQLGVGALVGTDVLVRYLPQSELSAFGGSYGEVGLFGLSVRHDIDQWIPAPIPLEIAVQGSWNDFTLATEDPNSNPTEFQDVLNASGWAVNLHVSRGIPVVPLIVYGGLQYEKFNVDYNYSYNPITPPPESEEALEEPLEFSLSQTAANQFRGVIGLSLTVPFARLSLDYARSQNDTVTASIGIRL